MCDSKAEPRTDNDKLCSCCQYMIQVTTLARPFPHHQKTQELRESAQRGCPICVQLWECYFNDAEEFESIRLSFALYNDAKDCDFSYSFYKDYPGSPVGEEIDKKALVGTFTARPADEQANTGSCTPSASTASKQTWDTAIRWLYQCISGHSRCGRKGLSGWLPSRVLDVGTPNDPFLRLHIPSENSSKSPYTTLSHCWGTLKIKRLTKANMISMLTSIEISELPKTFQHAIIITRRLGLRYLWIDSLCIIQDSFQDWAQESARMGEIYKNCFCNIAAAAALDGRYGCFMVKNTVLAQYCRVGISNCATGSNSAIFNLVLRMLWKLQLDNSPLGRRAWVVQEKFLAPRVLHFGKNQLFWECHDLCAGEMCPEGLSGVQLGLKHGPDSDFYNAKNSANERHNMFALGHGAVAVQFAETRILWTYLVGCYSACFLTKSTDRLNAISAIAREIQSITKDDYLAGLWKRVLPLDLLWWSLLPEFGKQPHCRHKDYCAPSWSWASIDAHVLPFCWTIIPDSGFMIKILDANVDAVTSDIFGRVSGGYIRLRGWLRELYSETGEWYQTPLDDNSVRAFNDDSAEAGWRYFLPILEAQYTPGSEVVWGLILIRTATPNQYRRVGIFDCDKNSKSYTFMKRSSYSSHMGTRWRKECIEQVAVRENCKRKIDTGEGEKKNARSKPQGWKWDADAGRFCLDNAVPREGHSDNSTWPDRYLFPYEDAEHKRLYSKHLVDDTAPDRKPVYEDETITLSVDPEEKELNHIFTIDADNAYVSECSCVICASDRAPTRALSSAIKEQWSSMAGDALHLNEDNPSDAKNAEKTHPDGSRGLSNNKEHNDEDDNDDDEVVQGFDSDVDHTDRMRGEWVECLLTII